MFHHLDASQKPAMLQEIFRLLKPGGKLYLYDFAPPRGRLGKLLATLYRNIEDIDPGIFGQYPVMIQEVGFRNTRLPFRSRMFGLLVAEKPR